MAAEISPGVERSIRAFLESLAAKGGPPLHTLSVAAARDVLRSAQSGEAEVLPADISDRTLLAGTSGSVSARIVRPQSATGMLPGIVYFHGGGWVLGDKDTHDRLVREIANGAQAAVVFVNYTPSPEARFPVAIEEAYAATQWIASNGPTIGIDATRLAVAGDSVGGNMAAAVTMLAKERGGPSLVRQVLFYPVTDANFDTGSYRQFAEGHFLTRDAMQWFWNHYAPNADDRRKPLASPLQASIEQLTELPPALVITAEFDVLRDEGEAYARKLNDAGVRVTATRYLGAIHDFVLLNPITQAPPARGAIAQAIAYLREAFGK